MIPTLKQPVELRVLSNADVVDEVRRVQPTKSSAYKAPTAIASIDPGVDFAMRPFDMLLELGAASVPPLPDHLRLASRWALLRYGWALAAPSGPLSPLRLGVYGDRLRYHHRTLLSEEIGVGLACWTCSELLGARWPEARLRRVDAEAALAPKAGPIPIAGTAGVTVKSDRKRPDYFWVAYDPRAATILEVVVLECKGTHDSRHVFKQLGDAMPPGRGRDRHGRRPPHTAGVRCPPQQ
jgi:hypothetical protein